MSAIAANVRVETLEDFREHAATTFAARPQLQSMIMAVAQYWADEADDAVHCYLVGSERRTPVWPHRCPDWVDGDYLPQPIPGETCEHCEGIDYMSWGDNNEMMIAAFAPYCNEHGSQDEAAAESYTPYAIARRTTTGVEIELVGQLLRPDHEIPERDGANEHAATARPFEGRAKELFDIVCSHPRDDSARRVLADFLLEQDDPRGEYMSLALATDLDETAAARRDALLDEHKWSWIHPLAHAVPTDGARFERGLLAHVDVYCETKRGVRVWGAQAWGSVETIRFLAGHDSNDILHSTMRALREVGPIGHGGIAAIAGAEHPWAIEVLHVVLGDENGDDREAISLLANTSKLPRLRRLTIERGAITPFVGAPWRDQIEELTRIDSLDMTGVWFLLLPKFDPLPRIAIVERGLDGQPAGWKIGATLERYDVTMVGWKSDATRDRLGAALDALPDRPVELVPSRYWQPTADDIAALSRPGRAVSIR